MELHPAPYEGDIDSIVGAKYASVCLWCKFRRRRVGPGKKRCGNGCDAGLLTQKISAAGSWFVAHVVSLDELIGQIKAVLLPMVRAIEDLG